MTQPTESAGEKAVADIMDRINGAWPSGRPGDMTPFLSESVAMALPGFSGTVQGREAFVAGFRDFCRTALLHECQLASPVVTSDQPSCFLSASFPRWRSMK
jgi:hypothetical protein